MPQWSYSTPSRPLGVCAALLVASCQQAGIMDPRGPISSAERLLLFNSTAIMLVVVVPVILATLGFAWWYRSSNTRASRSWWKSRWLRANLRRRSRWCWPTGGGLKARGASPMSNWPA